MKSRKLFIIMLVVVGLCLTGIQFSDAATKECNNCCEDCAKVYSDQVGPTPYPSTFRDKIPSSSPGIQPSNLTCFAGAIFDFAVCCWATDCGAPGKEFWFYLCVGNALGAHSACEGLTADEQEDCQEICRTRYDCTPDCLGGGC